MRITTKTIGVAASAALIVGAITLATTPAQAKISRTYSGASTVALPSALVAGAKSAGVTIAPIKPATAKEGAATVAVSFPVVMPSTDTELPHKGGLTFTSATTKIAVAFSNPSIAYTQGGDTATISGTISGIPASNPAAVLNGKPLALLDVKNFTSNYSITPAKKSGKAWKKVITQTMSGDVYVSSNALVVDGVNALMGVAVLTAGSEFGTLNTSWSTVITCTTKAECG